MKLAYASPGDHLQQAGEECASCRLFWEVQGIPPMLMEQVYDAAGNPVRTDGGVRIIVCPYCDSDTILQSND